MTRVSNHLLLQDTHLELVLFRWPPPSYGLRSTPFCRHGCGGGSSLCLLDRGRRNVAVAEVGFFDGLFERHGTHGDGFVGADQVHLCGFGHRGISVHGDRHGGFFGQADFGLRAGAVILRRVAVPLLYFFALAGRALLDCQRVLYFTACFSRWSRASLTAIIMSLA